MSSKPLKKDEDSTALTEIIKSSNLGSDNAKVLNDPVNSKVQEKFDAVFEQANPENSKDKDFNAEDFNFDDSATVVAPKSAVHEIGDINLEFDFGSDSEEATAPASDHNDEATVVAKLDNTLGFDLSGEAPMQLDSNSSPEQNHLGTSTDNLNDLSFDAEATVLNFSDGKGHEQTLEDEKSSDLFTSSQIKENIEATINDIVKPRKNSDTGDIDLDELKKEQKKAELTEILNLEKENTGDLDIDFNVSEAKNAATENLMEEEDPILSQAIVTEFSDKKKSLPINGSIKNSSNVNGLDDSLFDENDGPPSLTQIETGIRRESVNDGVNYKAISDDEYVRLQATIRQMREEREELLAKIKDIRMNSKEIEQDNLTLRAALDEAKIENSIIRKRQLNETEDLKHRLSLAEERKNMALELAKQLEKQKEKLEQKTRIDFGQIRQREKELESKLELMAMDVDSQVNSRDQKILELRRKIDALEFNMENASIREQKSTDDKRKLEDKLNKIMKTLRNSIKNLEDDLDYSVDHKINVEKSK